MFFWFYAVNSLPLSEAVSLSFLTPIITTIASMIFLKEKVSKNIFMASFISFIGVIIILRPGFHKFDEEDISENGLKASRAKAPGLDNKSFITKVSKFEFTCLHEVTIALIKTCQAFSTMGVTI